jgi:hypothetical protein
LQPLASQKDIATVNNYFAGLEQVREPAMVVFGRLDALGNVNQRGT